MSIRHEVITWFKVAYMDCVRARESLERNDKAAATFWAQQCVEKALKAYGLYKRKRIHGHNIKKIHEELEFESLGFSSSEWSEIYTLTRYYTLSRYPNVSGALPEDVITMDEAKKAVELAWKVLLRIKEKIGIDG